MRQAFRGADEVARRVVQQHVDTAKLLNGALQHGLHLVVLAHVAGNGQDLAAGLLAQLGRGFFQHVQLTAGDGHVGTQLQEVGGHGPAQAGAAAGHNNGFADQRVVAQHGLGVGSCHTQADKLGGSAA